MTHPLIRSVRRGLAEQADPEKADRMAAYMKSTMPYYGVQTAARRVLSSRLFARHPLPDFATWRDVLLDLWRGAHHREERYVAIDLSEDRRYRSFQTMKALPIYEEMIVTGAWWDYVDPLATHCLRALLERSPATMRLRMRSWSRSPDLWKRRSSILCQVGRKSETDLELLYACIEPSLSEREFFLRKAIGWALRSYAWTDAAEVRRYVGELGDRLSPLSRREALKNIGPEG